MTEPYLFLTLLFIFLHFTKIRVPILFYFFWKKSTKLFY